MYIHNICNMYTYTEFDDDEGEGKERKTKESIRVF